MPPICPMNPGTQQLGIESRPIGQAHEEKKCTHYQTRHTSRHSNSDASDAHTQQRDPDKRLTVRDLTLAETIKMEKLEQDKCINVKPSGSYTEIGTEEQDCKDTSHGKGEMITKKKRDIKIIGVSQAKYNFSVSMEDISCPVP